MMKAVIFNSFGGPDVLQIADVPRPQIKGDEMLVRVHAAAINPKDTFIRKGRFKRFTGDHFPMLQGFDFAGEVAEAGSRIETFKKGGYVYGMLDGWQGGTCAEYVAVKMDQVAQRPSSLSCEEAAALPLASLTALQALRDKANIKAGEKVCINGASGGVGSMAVQIAKIFGAYVTAVSRAENHDFLRELGADSCIDYRDIDIAKSDQEFDVFFDVFGNQRFRAIKSNLSRNGVWISTVLQPHVVYSVMATRFIGRKKAKSIVVESSHEDLNIVRNWVDAGLLKPIIHGVFPLDQIRAAHAQQETKHTRGKIIVSIY